MSAILGAIITVVIVVYIANMLGRQWRERDEELAWKRRLNEIEAEKKHLLRECAALLAEEATLVTYDGVAARLPEHIIRTIERTRP